MKKYTVFLISLISFIVFASAPVKAEQVAGTSAMMQNVSGDQVKLQEKFFYSKKKAIIKRVLERYGSPMADSADAFVDACYTYNIDCYLLPSIAGLESTFGKFTHPDSHNPFGWARGYMMFKDWRESIMTVAAGLRSNYVNKGALTIQQIGPIYSESPTWAQRVSLIHTWFEQEESNNELFFAYNSVQL